MTAVFTEFTCRSGGSNTNGGAIAANTEAPTAAKYATTNGNYNGTTTFTPTDGSTPASSIAVGDFAGVYVDGATEAAVIQRVTAVAAGANGAITLSNSVKAGTNPSSSATGRSIKVGGAWAGPAGATMFPLNLATLNSLNPSSVQPRINIKNDQTYSVTAGTTNATTTAAVDIQGYTSAFGDGGRATINGGTSGASYTILNLSSAGVDPNLRDLIFLNNGSTGSAAGVTVTGRNICRNVVFAGMCGAGLSIASALNVPLTALVECEIYGNNTNNTATIGGLLANGGFTAVRCFIHDNAGGNTRGIYQLTSTAASQLIDCIISTNGSHGFESAVLGSAVILNTEFYNNAGSGFYVTGGNFVLFVENCNFVKNGTGGAGFGLRFTTGFNRNGNIANCGFGAGTQANTSGDIDTANQSSIIDSGSVSYATGVTPWNDPANGDFTITLAAAKNFGRAAWVETSAGLSAPNTVGYADIGAARHVDPSGGSLLLNPGMRGGML